MEEYQHCQQYQSDMNLIRIYAYVICKIASKRTHFFHIVKDIITYVKYWYSSASLDIFIYGLYMLRYTKYWIS